MESSSHSVCALTKHYTSNAGPDGNAMVLKTPQTKARARAADKPTQEHTCKFRNAKCYNCQRVGHIASACESDSRKPINTNPVSVNELESELFFVTHEMSNASSYRMIRINVTLPVTFLIDTGSPVTLISEPVFREAQRKHARSTGSP